MDRLHEQNNPTYHKLLAAGPVSVVPVYTPGGCTDLVAVIDDPAIGKTEKDLIKKRFRADFMARPDQYCNGDVKPAEFRTLLVTWTKGARMEFMDAHSSSIKYAFQRKGMLNAIDGSENYLIQIEQQATLTFTKRAARIIGGSDDAPCPQTETKARTPKSESSLCR